MSSQPNQNDFGNIEIRGFHDKEISQSNWSGRYKMCYFGIITVKILQKRWPTFAVMYLL